MIQTISLQEKRRTINTIIPLCTSFKPRFDPKICHLRPFTRAKDCWEHIISLYKGSSSIQRSNFEVVLDEADEFVMLEDEDPHDLYRRVTTLAVALQDHGSKDTDDNWIKRKFLKAIMPFNKAMSSVIRQRPYFHTLTSSEVLDEFIAMNIMNKTANNALARVRSKKSSSTLALKARPFRKKKRRLASRTLNILTMSTWLLYQGNLEQQEDLKA